MTKAELKQMKKVFPNGYEESDIPAYIRQRPDKHLGIEIIITLDDQVIMKAQTQNWEMAEMELGKLERFWESKLKEKMLKEDIESCINYAVKEGYLDDDTANEMTDQEKEDYYDKCMAYDPPKEGE